MRDASGLFPSLHGLFAAPPLHACASRLRHEPATPVDGILQTTGRRMVAVRRGKQDGVGSQILSLDFHYGRRWHDFIALAEGRNAMQFDQLQHRTFW